MQGRACGQGYVGWGQGRCREPFSSSYPPGDSQESAHGLSLTNLRKRCAGEHPGDGRGARRAVPRRGTRGAALLEELLLDDFSPSAGRMSAVSVSIRYERCVVPLCSVPPLPPIQVSVALRSLACLDQFLSPRPSPLPLLLCLSAAVCCPFKHAIRSAVERIPAGSAAPRFAACQPSPAASPRRSSPSRLQPGGAACRRTRSPMPGEGRPGAGKRERGLADADAVAPLLQPHSKQVLSPPASTGTGA